MSRSSFAQAGPNDRVGGIVERVAASWPATVAVLLALCCAAFLPGLATIPPIDRDETRFAQASRQMLESGDFVDIRFQDRARHKKPVGIYWLQAASAAALGGPQASILAYRLPSFLGACAAVVATAALGRTLFGGLAGLLAGAMLAASILLGVEARLAKTDAVLLALVAAAQAMLVLVYRDALRPVAPGWWRQAVLWTATGLAVLVKGPIGPLVLVLTVAALSLADRRVGWVLRLRPLFGVAVVAAVAAPWLVAITLASDGRFWADSLGADMLAKVGAGQESHGAPPGVHTLAMPLLFWPGSAVLLAALPLVWAMRDQPAARALIAWAAATFVMFELATTKLPHYTLPAYPALAILAAAAVASGRPPRRLATAGRIAAALAAVVAFGAVVALVVREGEVTAPALLLATATAVAAAAVWRAMPGLGPSVATMGLAAVSVLLGATVFGAVAPRLTDLSLSPRIAAEVRAFAGCADPTAVTTSYREPSLVFAIGTDLRIADGAGAADVLASDPCAVALVDGRDAAAFAARAAQIGLDLRSGPVVEGTSIGNGRRVRVTLWRSVLEGERR